MKVLCIDVGGTYIKYALMNGRHDAREDGKVVTPRQTLEQLVDEIRSLYKASDGAQGIALSMPGVIDTDTGFMHTGGSLQYIKELPMADIISEACDGVPVSIENDAKAAAIAELEAGALQNYNNAVVITVGTAVGGTIIIKREPLRGANLFAGELSYVIYDTNTLLTNENRRENLWASHGVPAQMCEFYGDAEITGEEITRRMNDGEKKAIEAVRKSAKQLAMLIYNLQCIIDPEVFAIGGGISAQKKYIEILREETEKLNVTRGPAPKIIACHFGNSANLLGAYYSFARRFTDGKTKEPAGL